MDRIRKMIVIAKLMIMLVLLCFGNDFLLTCSGANVHEEPVVILCKDNEREALLTLKQGLQMVDPDDDSGTTLTSWGGGKDNMDCCFWDGVICNYMTGHVTRLKLVNLRGEISPALLGLRNLTMLSLEDNDFGKRKIPEFVGSLINLEYLRFKSSNLSGDVSCQLRNLTNLRELDLYNNDLTSKDLTWLSNLALLSYLDLSYNQFEGPFPDLKALSQLARLDLSSNNLTGQLPTSIGQLSSLQFLDVSDNSLEGTISDVHFTQLHHLIYLDLSFNSLSLNFTPEWIPPFQVFDILLARCNMGPRFPTWLQTQTQTDYFKRLDLSSSGISEEVPSWFWNFTDQLVYLNLSHNSMSGFLPDLSRPDPQYELELLTIDMSFNNFSGPLPNLPSNVVSLDLSHNMFSGKCSKFYSDKLIILDLSYNQLSGDLPNFYENMPSLSILNLAQNRLDGHIPPSLGSLGDLQALILRNNNFTGELPSTLSGCQVLKFIDCGGNTLTGNVPMWMGSLTQLTFLILGQNNFYGNIPPNICHFSQIQVLDLSQNNISGRIPQCFQNFTSLIQKNGSTDTGHVKPASPRSSARVVNLYMGSCARIDACNDRMRNTVDRLVFDYVNNGIVRWKRQESEYKNTLGLLKLIDLSSNKLVGNIPQEISHLAGLGSLNLSHNHLTGNINSEIGEMKMLESLDLSRNNLSGLIPTGLAGLSGLAVLDLSNNNLSGEIPKGTQLQSFDKSAYTGNNELCGPPLPNCHGDVSLPPAAPRGIQGNTDDEKDEEFSFIDSLREAYFISPILGYIVGFWVTFGPLLIKRSWRDAYFGYLSKIGDWFYVNVTVTLSWRRLRYMKSRK